MNLLLKFYTDEHIGNAITAALRKKGIEIQTCQEAGLLGESDETHFKYAFREKRAIITNDNDFLKLASQKMEHFGIVFIVNQRTDIGVIVKRITQLHNLVDAERFKNQIEYI